MYPRVGIAVFVIKDGKFLMGQRRGAHGLGTWSVPGGWLEYHEEFVHTAIREVKEETGMDITNIRFGGVSNNIFKDEKLHSITIWMVADWKSGEPTITEPDKFIDQTWVNFDNLPSPLFLPWNSFLKSEFVATIKDELAVS